MSATHLKELRQETESNLRLLYEGVTFAFVTRPELKLSKACDLYTIHGMSELLRNVWQWVTGTLPPSEVSGKKAFKSLGLHKLTDNELYLDTPNNDRTTDTEKILLLCYLAHEPIPEGNLPPEVQLAMLLGVASARRNTYLHDVKLSIREMSAGFIKRFKVEPSPRPRLSIHGRSR